MAREGDNWPTLYPDEGLNCSFGITLQSIKPGTLMSSVKQVMKPSVIIAIDPGACGGIAICADRKVSATKLDEQESYLLIDGLCANFNRRDIVCYMEQVGGYIGKEQPGSMMFNFGNGYGYWRGVLKALDIQLQLVVPQKWMRKIAPGVIGMDYGERKRALKALAIHWYPELEVTNALADALGLLRYAMGGPASEAPVVSTGRSRAGWPADVRGFKKWFKKQKGAFGEALPTGTKMIEGVNWWVEQGRPEK
jgi:hypothetical protein